MSTTFSIIMPAYNRGYVIWKVIQSIVSQKYPFWELIIIDDGSTDNTKQVIAEFQNDSRIKYFYAKHKNGSAARNLGLKKAKGEIITYVDSDDRIYDIYLTTAFELFTKFPKKVFATCNYNRRVELYDDNFQLIDFTQSSSAQKNEVSIQRFYHWEVKTCGTGIFHKRSETKNIKWDENIVMLDDLDFILQMGNKFPNDYLHIPYALFEYLQKYGGDGICSNTSYKDQGKAFEKIYKKHQKDPLMKGQSWYPDKILKYKKLERDFQKGLIRAPIFKYFPNAKR